MRHYNTKEDLELVLSQNKPEPVIRAFWFDYKKGEAYREFLDAMINGKYDEDGKYIPSEYEKLYPDYDENGDPINYVETDEYEIKFDSETGEEKIELILPDNCYEEKEVENEFGYKEIVKVIKEDCVYRPTKEAFLTINENKFEEPADETLLPEYLEFIKPIIINKVQEEADNVLKEIKSILAGKSLTIEQEERYKYKYDLAVKAKETGDYKAFELEAKMVGVSPETLADIIIKTGDEWKIKLAELSIIIDGVRVALARKVKEIDDVEELNIIPKIVDELKSLGLNITVDGALKIIERYLG